MLRDLSCGPNTCMDNLTWLLSRTRAYLLAVASTLSSPNVAVTLNISHLALNAASIAWLCEIPNQFVCAMPIKPDWISFVEGGIITYFRGDLSRAETYSMCLFKMLRPKSCAYATLCDRQGGPLKDTGLNGFIFWDIDNPVDSRNQLVPSRPDFSAMRAIVQ